MRNASKVVALLASLLLCASAAAQIPSGYVNTTGTNLALAGGSLSASWTNLSSSPQLALLGCQSTFQTTVSTRIDSFGHFAVLLADTAQICPSPSTWDFILTCSTPSLGSYPLAVPVTGGGGTEDISTQILAALPATPCNNGGGGGPYVSTIVTTPQTIVSALNTQPAIGTAGYPCADGYSLITGKDSFQCIQHTETGGDATAFVNYGAAMIDQVEQTGGRYTANFCTAWDASFAYVAGQCVSNAVTNWVAVTPVQGVAPAAGAWTNSGSTGDKTSMDALMLAATSTTSTQSFDEEIRNQNLGAGEKIGLEIRSQGVNTEGMAGGEANEGVRLAGTQSIQNFPVESLITGTVASGAGATVTGAAGTNCLVSGFPNGANTLAYVGVSAGNTIAANAPLTFLNAGGSCTASVCATGSPVTLTLSNGYNGNIATQSAGGQQGGAAVCSGTITANLTASVGGIYTGTLGAVAAGPVNVPVTSTFNSLSMGERRPIRDLGNELDCNYTWTTVLNSGTFPPFNTQQLAVTGSGCSGTLPWNATNPHTTWNCPALGGLPAGNPACSGQIMQTNAIACFDGAASNGLDACVPITNFSGGVLTVNLFGVGTQASQPWPSTLTLPGGWALTGIVRIYGAAIPTAIQVTGSTVTGFTAADTSGLTTGHTVDQVASYNTSYESIHAIDTFSMGLAGQGNGFAIYRNPPPNSAPENAGASIAGLFNYGVLVDGRGPNQQSYAQLASIAWAHHSASNVMLQDNAIAANWTVPECYFQINTFSDGNSHCAFTIDPTNKFLGVWDNAATISMGGNITANGWVVTAFFGTGPYPGNLITFSGFQGSSNCSTGWTLGGTTAGGSCLNGQSGDIFMGSSAAVLQAGALIENPLIPVFQDIQLTGNSITPTAGLPYYFGVTASIPVGALGTVSIANAVVTGTGTATLTSFNGGSTGANVLVNVVSGVPTNFAGTVSPYSIVNAGSGATAGTTTASCGSTTGSASCSAGTITVATTLLMQSTMVLSLHSGSSDPCAALKGSFSGAFPSVGFNVTTTPQLYSGYCIPTTTGALTPIIASFGSGVALKLSQASAAQSSTGLNPQLITNGSPIAAGFGCISLGHLCPSISTGTPYDAAVFSSVGGIVGIPPANFDATAVLGVPTQKNAQWMGDSQTFSQGGNCAAGLPGTGTCWMPVLSALKGWNFGKNIAASGNHWYDQLKLMFQNASNSPYTGGPMLYTPNTTTLAGLGQNDANQFSSVYITYPTNPTAGDTIVVNGSTVTWEAGTASGPNQVNVGVSNAVSVANLQAVLCPNVNPIYTGSTPSCGSADSNIVKSIYFTDSGSVSGANLIRVQPVLSCTAPPCSTLAQTLSQTGSGAATLYATLPTAAQITASITAQAEFAAVVQTAIPAASANGGNGSFISAQAMTSGGSTCTPVNSQPWGFTSNYYAMSCTGTGTLQFQMSGSAFYIGYQGSSTLTPSFNYSIVTGSGTFTNASPIVANCVPAYPVGIVTGCLARVPTPGSNGTAQITLSVASGTMIFIFGASNGNAVGTLDQSDFRLWETFDSVNNLDSVYSAIRQGERAAVYTLAKQDGMPVQDIPVGQQFNCQVNFSQCGGTGQHQALSAIQQFIAPFLGETSGVVFRPAETAQGVGDQLPQGTITGVTPGAGLSGGGTTGNVTLNLAPFAKLSTPILNTGNTSLNEVATVTVPAGTMGLNSHLKVDEWGGACYGIGTPYSACSFLSTVTGISGGSGFSGSGTLFLTAFNNGCTGTTVTVTITAGSFTSAVVTAPGTGCTTISGLTATCTSGTATCTGSPVTINVTATAGANTGTCQWKVFFSGSSGSGGQSLVQSAATTAKNAAHLIGSVSNENSLSAQIQDGMQYATSGSSLVPISNTVNTANASFFNIYVQNSVSTDLCGVDQYTVDLVP